ncbi:unnamed protein product [marine sediment metagenome]|uniref:Peptidase S8/S53 domain-containing protein n=1 Tax=marine sediment metagenome TaxID=412755 RepID=X1LS64_9ZZZZ
MIEVSQVSVASLGGSELYVPQQVNPGWYYDPFYGWYYLNPDGSKYIGNPVTGQVFTPMAFFAEYEYPATEEEVVLGIERVCELVMEALAEGLQHTNPLWPNVINLSLGAEDDGDPDSPMRLACRIASTEYGLDVVASAGNYGPDMTTITTPGTEPEVITVGAIESVHEIQVWELSSRGPTKEGKVKPDFVFWGADVEAANHENDIGYIVKSGTSFSTPMLSGLTGLLWETGRRVYGDSWLFRWTEARDLAPYYCLKPEDAPVQKGNTYGYGLPAVGTMVGRLATAKPEFEVTDMITPMILIMMMVSMMKIV